jgi:hypothetical protein
MASTSIDGKPLRDEGGALRTRCRCRCRWAGGLWTRLGPGRGGTAPPWHTCVPHRKSLKQVHTQGEGGGSRTARVTMTRSRHPSTQGTHSAAAVVEPKPARELGSQG